MIRNIPRDTRTFKFYNANPKGNGSCDCVVRAIATVTGKTWDEVLDALVEVAHKQKLMVTDPKLYTKYIESLGFRKMRQPRYNSGRKYTGKEFCELRTESSSDKYILAHIGGHHLVAIKRDDDGRYKVFDTWDSTDGCIGNYWWKDRD